MVIDGVRVPWEAAAGYVATESGHDFVPRVYNTLNVPLIQLIFANLYVGIAEGALATAATLHPRAHPAVALRDRRQGAKRRRVLRAGDLR